MMNDTVFRRSLVVLACILAALALAGAVLPRQPFEFLFEENGLIESLTVLAWLAAAAVFAWAALRHGGAVAWLAAPLCLAAALREADLHKSLTGFSVLKTGFYTGDAFALWQKLLAALVVVPAAVALVVLSVLLLRRMLAGGLRRRSVWLVLVAIGLLVFSKLIDRAPAVLLEDFGVDLPIAARRMMLAWEEGIEALLPLAFLLPYFAARREPEHAGRSSTSSGSGLADSGS